MNLPSARELRRAEAATSSCRSGLKLVDRASLPSKPVLDREGKHAKPDGARQVRPFSSEAYASSTTASRGR
jgi:hypothetical protein